MNLRYAVTSVSLILPSSVSSYLQTYSRRFELAPLFVTIPESSDSLPQPAATARSAVPYGGDYAGFSATFSPSSGSVIPVPEYLVPESLIEWGQIPAFFEVITSEELKHAGEMFLLARQTVTVLPEVGCGVDNLETTRSDETLELHLEGSDSDGRVTIVDDEVVALEYALPSKPENPRKRVETTFGLENKQRVRIIIDLENLRGSFSITGPVKIILERQTSASSTEGAIADGGGLDGRTVSRLIGTDIQNDPFPLQKPLKYEKMIGDWKRDHGEVMEGPALFEHSPEVLLLPGNVTVIHTTGPHFRLDVVHVSSDASERRVVRRLYDSKGSLLGDATYWKEYQEQ